LARIAKSAEGPGIISRKSFKPLARKVRRFEANNPVKLPPGRARLETNPWLTGSDRQTAATIRNARCRLLGKLRPPTVRIASHLELDEFGRYLAVTLGASLGPPITRSRWVCPLRSTPDQPFAAQTPWSTRVPARTRAGAHESDGRDFFPPCCAQARAQRQRRRRTTE